MAPEDDITVSGDRIVGVFGFAFIAFLLCCASCRQKKSSNTAPRRPAPPTPDEEQAPRYEAGLFPPTFVPSLTHPSPEQNNDSGSEEDFEYMPNQMTDPAKNMSCRNSADPRKSTADTNSQGSYVNIIHNYSYENVSEIPKEDSARRKHHTYLVLLPNDSTISNPDPDVTSEQGTAEQEVASRRARVKSHPRHESISEPRCHSYENIALGVSPVSVEVDYVNLA